jgi:hypothetical protein
MCLNETCRKIRVGERSSDIFPIQNGLKQEDALLQMLFNFALEYAIMKVQEDQGGLKLSRTYQLPVYADDINFLGDSINTVKQNTEILLQASRDVGLEINAEKTSCLTTSLYPTSECNNS